MSKVTDISPDGTEPDGSNLGSDGPARVVGRVMTISAGLNIGLVVCGAIRFPSAWRADPKSR
jgi:hypothetical protein